MNITDDKFDDLMDEEIFESLKSMGYIFPQTAEDFIKIDEKLKKKPLNKSLSLSDPLSFLKKEKTTRINLINNDVIDLYKRNYSLAAREGKKIPDHIQRRMKEDKSNPENGND